MEEGRYLYLIGASGGGGENVVFIFCIYRGIFSDVGFSIIYINRTV
jgi:hypothetical protein